MFSCNIYEIFKNNYFEEHLRTTASAGPSMGNLNMILPEKMVNVSVMIKGTLMQIWKSSYIFKFI